MSRKWEGERQKINGDENRREGSFVGEDLRSRSKLRRRRERERKGDREGRDYGTTSRAPGDERGVRHEFCLRGCSFPHLRTFTRGDGR